MKHQMGQGNSVDYILDAIDTVTAKLALAGFAASHAIPVIASMGTGNKLHPELFRISDISQTSVCPLCKVMRRELKARNIRGLRSAWSPEQPLTPGQTAEDTGCRRATPGKHFFCTACGRTCYCRRIIRDICGLALAADIPLRYIMIHTGPIPERPVKPAYKLLCPQHIDNDMFICFLHDMDGVVYLIG